MLARANSNRRVEAQAALSSELLNEDDESELADDDSEQDDEVILWLFDSNRVASCQGIE